MNLKKVTIAILFLAISVTIGYLLYAKTHRSHENKQAENSNSDIAYYHCGMHTQIISSKPGKCPICGMDLTPVYKSKTMNDSSNNKEIKIDPVMVQNIGVRTEKVIKRKLTYTIRTTGRVDYDETMQKSIVTKFSGWIEKLYADYTGKPIQKGQPLFEIYSPELVAAQQEYLQAIRYAKTMKSINDSVLSNGSADLLQSARKKLLYWDISASQLLRLEQTGNIQKTLTVYSPFSGIIIEKNIVDGMQVRAGDNLLKLADISTMWIYADVYENELSLVKTGSNVIIELPGHSEKLTGKISGIYPFLQDQTRTAKVRIEYNNKDELLKKDMYVTVNIAVSTAPYAVSVPEQAVIHSGNRDIVVLSLGEGKFKSVNVQLGILSDGYYEVKEGVNEGDLIVTSSQFLIDSESNLRTGISSMNSHEMEKQDHITEK
jgi:Cu(I)/Ag(I) efflux system membrane fusion protein/cobalt-zinc-cadmium efflux system membrane fusion protein